MSQATFAFGVEPSRLEIKFREFHKDNPQVYVELRKLAFEWYRETRGQRPIGMACLYETLRFRIGIETNGKPYKLCNNHRAFYSRLLMIDEPQMVNIIRTKTQKEPCTL